MSLILAVETFPGGSQALVRHWPYFQRQRADKYLAVTTEGGGCFVPIGMDEVTIGVNRYIHGDHLPRRLVDTIETCLSFNYDRVMVCEYDILLSKRIPVEEMTGDAASYLAGGQTWGSKASAFYHQPLILTRSGALRFVVEGRKVISEGHCAYGTPESSPDVFTGYVCERLGMPVQTDLFQGYSQHSITSDEQVKAAQEAIRKGAHCVHGVKTEAILKRLEEVM